MRNIRPIIVFGSVLTFAGMAPVEGAHADTPVKYTVDTPADFADGSCAANASSGGRCTLRAALAQADQVEGDVIVELLQDPVVSLGEILIFGDAGARITIQSQIPEGRRASITGSQNSRLFRVGPGATVTLFNLSIQAFRANGYGGAIFNEGTLNIRRSIIANSTADCLGSGILSAFSGCGGGAVWNSGTLNVTEGTRFESNHVTSLAYSAATVNATADGGAIGSVGPLTIGLPVAFVANTVTASAQTGFRPNVPGSAYAGAFGGAVASSGDFTFVEGPGTCEFLSNVTIANASALEGMPTLAESKGGAIYQRGSLVVPSVCEFHNNVAAVDPDVHVEP